MTSYFEESGILAYETVNFVIEVVKTKEDAAPHVTLSIETWLKYINLIGSMKHRTVWVDDKEIKQNQSEYVKPSLKNINIRTSHYHEYVDMNFTRCKKIKYILGISFNNKAVNYGWRRRNDWHIIYLFLLPGNFSGHFYSSNEVSMEIFINPLAETAKLIFYIVLAFVIFSYIRNKRKKPS